MYVLQHADKPEIYAGLPNSPRISPLVEAWKGMSKYAGLAVIGLTAAAGVLHYLLQGPTASRTRTSRTRRGWPEAAPHPNSVRLPAGRKTQPPRAQGARRICCRPRTR
jgi:hypothetical protein